MLLELMHSNFLEKDYRTLLIPSTQKKTGKLYIEYTLVEEAVYIVSILNYHNGTEWNRFDYDDVTRKVKAFFYEKGFENVHYLHVIATSHSNMADDLGIFMDPYWVVDDVNLRLMIYENQAGEFLDAKEIIEHSLQGKTTKKEKSFPIPIVAITLILINVVVFFVMEIVGSTQETDFMLRYGAMNVERIMDYREYYRFFTCMFLHFGTEHLINNMVVLAAFGYYIEGVLGRVCFLILYLVTGLVAGLASFGYNLYMERYVVVAAGASGAIFGLMGGLLYLVLKKHEKLQGLSFRRMAFFMALSLYSGFTSPGIDAIAHLGGFLGGLIAVLGMPVTREIGGKG